MPPKADRLLRELEMRGEVRFGELGVMFDLTNHEISSLCKRAKDRVLVIRTGKAMTAKWNPVVTDT